jgi:hypothetical protein
VGYLNPTLYALGNSAVFNSIDDGANNEYLANPDLYYTSGPGWNACTGWGSVNGSALLAALRGGVWINQFDYTPKSLAACVFQNKLFLFWVANDPSNGIYYSGSVDGLQWPQGKTIDTVDSTPQPLTAIPYNDDIYLFWAANDVSNAIYYSSFLFPASQKINDFDSTPLGLTACLQDGMVCLFWKSNDWHDFIYCSETGDFSVPWPAGNQVGTEEPEHGTTTFNQLTTRYSPAVTVYSNGAMVLFWTADDGSGSIYSSVLNADPTAANSPFNILPDASSQAGPAVCTFQGSPYLFWTSGNSIFWSVAAADGSWSTGINLSPGFRTTQAPAACVFNDLLYVFWTDETTNQIRFSASEDGLTWP